MEEIYLKVRREIEDNLIKNKINYSEWQGICEYIEDKYKRVLKKSTLVDTQKNN